MSHSSQEDSEEQQPADGLHRLLLDPTRLTIVALLGASASAEFGFVRDASGLTDSALSKQLRTLSDHQLVELEKARFGPRVRTWIRLTVHGHEVLASHTIALSAIARRAQAPAGDTR